MMQKLILFAGVVAFGVSLAFGGVAAAAPQSGCGGGLLTMPPWYRGVTDGNCNIEVKDFPKFAATVAGNIVEILLHVAAYVSAAFIIYGGFQYITSAGSVDGNTKGRKTIINACIGLLLSIMSVAIVRFVLSNI